MSTTSQPVAAHDIDALAFRALRISVVDGCLYAVMVGVSESYLAPMAVELGHRDASLALLLTLPMLAGSVLQLLSGPLIALLGARKRLVILGAVLQALSVLGLWYVAAYGVRALWPLLLADTLYFVCAMMIGPAWGGWMAELTEGRQRERYFARRAGWLQVALLIAYASAGFVLQSAGDDVEAKLEIFAALHICGFVFRLFSACTLWLQPDFETEARDVPESFAAVRTAFQTADFRVASYLALLMLGTHIAVPFFTPYMLRELNLDYATFAALTAVPIVVKAVLFPALHPISERFGMRALLIWSGVGVAIMPALWVLLPGLGGLVAVQVLSGLSWGALEFASYQLLLTSARSDCRVEFLSIATAMSSGAQVVGALGGGMLRTVPGWSFAALFLLSTLGRALALVWMVGGTRMFRPSEPAPRVYTRVISIRPGPGTLSRPIVHDTRRPEPSDEAAQ